MKFLSTIGKRLELIIFIISFVATIYVLVPIKYLTWHELPAPPERIVKIISTNLSDVIVETVSNKRYICNSYNGEQCWTEISYNTHEFGTTLCYMEDCPNTHIVQMTRTEGVFHDFGAIWITYALHDDGMVYVKHTGFPYPGGIWMGTIIGGLCAFVTYIGKSLFLGVFSLLRKHK